MHNRQSTVSFKNKKVVRKPESEWFRVENTHEAIITKEKFLQVQEQIDSRRRVCQNGQGLGQCSMHYIRYDVLYGYVLSRLQYWSEQVHRDDEKLLQQLLNAGNKERSAAKNKEPWN